MHEFRIAQSLAWVLNPSVNAIFLAIILTAVVILDYVWDFLPKKISGKNGISKSIKLTVIIILLITGWMQAWIQYRRDIQSDKDMEFTKNQLVLANISLTNTTATINGLSSGGDSYAEVGWFPSLTVSNTIDISVISHGDYPVRNLSVKISNQTKRFLAGAILSDKGPPDEIVYERFLGDLPLMNSPTLCHIALTQSVTNRFRIDVNELNGWDNRIYELAETTNGWGVRLAAQWRRINGKVTIQGGLGYFLINQ